MTRNAAVQRKPVAAVPGVVPITRGRKPSAGDLLLGRQWLMLPERVQSLRAFAAQALTNPNALTAWADAPVPNTFLGTERDGIATLRINGPMCRVWDFWAWVFGCVPYEFLAKDLLELKNNTTIRAVIISGDTPGGEALGCGELASIIRTVDAVKPVVWHAAGLTCSAGVWLASAARRFYVDRTAITGSIGACHTYVDFSGMYEELGIEVIEMVSSQSPKKNSNPTTEEGRAEWQRMLDSIAAVFIADVAKNRGVDEATVLSDYGQGGVFVGEEAVAAGLADAAGTDEEVRAALLSQLNDNLPPEQIMARATAKPKTKVTSEKARAEAATRRAKAEEETQDEEDDDEEEEPEAAADDPEDGDDEEDDDEDETPGSQAITLPAGLSAQQQAESFEAIVPDAAAVLRAEATTAERDRILGIYELSTSVAGSPKALKMIGDGMKDPKSTADSVSRAMVRGGVFAGTAALSARAEDEKNLDPPSNADGPEAANSSEALATQMVTLFRANSKR